MKMKYEVRIMDDEDAAMFIQNMRWFAGYGRITWESLGNGRTKVRATRSAWSNWAGK